MTLWYCAAGGNPLDIGDLRDGVNDKVTHSLWIVVDNNHVLPELNIILLESYVAQTKVKEGFREKYTSDINCCVGAINGLLIWMNKLSVKDVKVLKLGPPKFSCDRKLKYGSNLVGV